MFLAGQITHRRRFLEWLQRRSCREHHFAQHRLLLKVNLTPTSKTAAWQASCSEIAFVDGNAIASQSLGTTAVRNRRRTIRPLPPSLEARVKL